MEGGTSPYLASTDSRVQEAGAGGLQNLGTNSDSIEHQLAEKLERSEAGRKKLRQAIALLKERLEATTQVLEVNESLRREVEKERLRADTERTKAESEKVLREKLEIENLTVKEHLIQVLQRLDYVENSQKADQIEVSRIRLEVKETVEGIGAALQAVEAARGLYQNLERTFHAKVNGAVQSSTRALSVAQSGQASSSSVQAKALAAQSLAKAVQKEVQLLASQVASLQKQGSNLSLHISSLQQDSQLKGPGTPLNSPDSGETDASLAVTTKDRVLNGAVSPTSSSGLAQRGMVLCKSQRAPQLKDSSIEGETIASASPSIARGERPPNAVASCSLGLPPRAGTSLNRSQLQTDEGSKAQTSLPQIRHLARSHKNGIPEMSTRVESTVTPPLSQPVSTLPMRGSVAIITGVDSILSPAVNQPLQLSPSPSTTSSLYITVPSHSQVSNRQGEVHPPKSSDAINMLGSEERSFKRFLVKRCGGATSVQGASKMSDGVDGHLLKSGQRSESVSNQALTLTNQQAGRPVPSMSNPRIPEPISEISPNDSNAATKLLKSINRMFEKERKSRNKMEEKLLLLQGILVQTCEPVEMPQLGIKRKRGGGKKRDEGTLDKDNRKKPRRVKVCRNTLDGSSVVVAVDPQRKSPSSFDELIKGPLQEEGQEVSPKQVSDTWQLPQGTPQEKGCIELGVAEGSREMDVDFQEVRVDSGGQGTRRVSDMKYSNKDTSKNGMGWDSDFESTDDDAGGEDWWAKKVLLSPTLPDISVPPFSPLTLSLQADLRDVVSIEHPFKKPSFSTSSLMEQSVAGIVAIGLQEDFQVHSKVYSFHEDASNNESYSVPSNVAQSPDTTTTRGTEPLFKDMNPSMMSLQDITCFLDDLPNVSCPPSTLDIAEGLHTVENSKFIENNTAFQSSIGPHGTFILEEKVLRFPELEVSDMCHIKRTLIESNKKHLKQQEVEGTDASDAVLENPMHPTQMDEEQQPTECSDELPVSNKLSHMLKPVEETAAMDQVKVAEKSTGHGFNCCDTSEVRIGTAFTRTKKRLYDALNRKSPCKVQTGKQLGMELAAVATDSNLTGEELLRLFALALVEVPMLSQCDSTLQNASLLYHSASNNCLNNSLMQVIVLIEQVLSCEGISKMLVSENDGIDVLLRHLQKFLIRGNLRFGGSKAGKFLCTSSLQEHTYSPQELQGCACQDGSIERAKTGGRILAGLCQAHGRMDSLEVFMYTYLSWYRYETCWLLAIVSSLVAVCGKSLFSASSGVITSHAVQAIILELLVSVEENKWESAPNIAPSSLKSGQPLSDGLHHTSFWNESQILQSFLREQGVEGLDHCLHHILVAIAQILSSPDFLLPVAISPSTIPSKTLKMDKVSELKCCCCCTESSTGKLLLSRLDGELGVGLRCPFIDLHSPIQPPPGCNILQHRFWDVCRSLQLISVQLGWNWTYNDLIVGHLWGLVTPGASQSTTIAVAHLLGVLGRLGVMDDGTELPGVDGIREQLFGVFQQTTFSEAARVAASQALVNLSLFKWEGKGKVPRWSS